MTQVTERIPVRPNILCMLFALPEFHNNRDAIATGFPGRITTAGPLGPSLYRDGSRWHRNRFHRFRELIIHLDEGLIKSDPPNREQALD
ncbi:MAG: hypothetical protein ACP5EN_07360 [Rhodovulum sp.]